MSTKRIELLLMYAWAFLIVPIVLFIPSFILLGTLAYVVPGLYLSWRLPEHIQKASVYSLCILFLWTTFDYIWEVTGAWGFNSEFPFRLFSVIPIEFVLWAFLYPYFIIMFYEYFFEHDERIEKTRRETLALLIISIIGFLSLCLALIFSLDIFNIPYSYLTLGSVVILVPIVYIAFVAPKLWKKFFKVGAFFAVQSLILEFLALHLGFWFFPSRGEFIGQMTLFQFTFPIEEFVLWILFGALGILALYEIFDDDRR